MVIYFNYGLIYYLKGLLIMNNSTELWQVNFGYWWLSRSSPSEWFAQGI